MNHCECFKSIKFYIDLMSFRKSSFFLIAVFVIFLSTSGCMDYSFGDLSYDGSKLNLDIQNNGKDRPLTVQITVFSLKDFRQTEYSTYVETVYLKHGHNSYSVPAKLEKGNYKMYLYILENGKRASAEIRNINV